VKDTIINFIGFIQASRVPNQLIIALTQVLTALILLGQDTTTILSLDFLGLIVTTQMIAAAGYIINDYYDQKIDMINRPDKVIVGVKLKRRQALIAHTLLNVGGIAFGWFIDPLIGLVHLVSAFSLWYYSNNLRRLPLIGNLIIASLTGMIFLIVSILFRATSSLIMIYALFAFTVTLVREIIKDIEDVKGESAFGCKTIPVIWGIRGSKLVIYLISLIGFALLTFFLIEEANLTATLFFAIVSPFYLWFLIALNKADTQKDFNNLHAMSNGLIFTGILSIVFL
jgi:4-hydroxybenzoate polyprenyltransferase